MKKLLLRVNTTTGGFTDWNDTQYDGVDVVHGDSVLLACQFTEALASTLSELDLTGAQALRATVKTARTSDATLLAFQDSYNEGLFVSYEDISSGYVTWLLAMSGAAIGTALGSSDSVSAWLEFTVLDENSYPQTLAQIPITIYQQVDDGATGTPSPTSPTYLTATEIRAQYNQKYIGKTTAPTTTDDSDSDYMVGGIWIDETNDAAYVCLDNTVDAAVWLHVQAYDAGLASIAGLTTAADKMIYTTDSDVYAVTDLTAFARSILDDADEATFKATVNLEIGTDVQAYDATLQSLSALGTAANKLAYTTDVDTWAETDITAAGRAILDDADAEAQRTTLGVVIGTDVQAHDDDLDAVAGLSSTGLVARTGDGTAAVRTITGTANEIEVANGDGVSDNPTLSLPSTISLSGKTISDLGTVTTADIDGGTLDNVTIGGTTPAAAAVTTLKVTTGAAANSTLISDADGNLSYVKNNYSASAAPTADDDSADGYAVGSLWLDTVTTEVYRCLDATEAAAVWETTTLSLDDLGSMATQNNDSVDIDGGTIDGTTIGAATPAAGTFTTVIATQSAVRSVTSGPTDSSQLQMGTDNASIAAFLITYGSAHVSWPGMSAWKNNYGGLAFFTGTSGSNSERARITSTGNVLLGTTSEPGTASRLVVKGSTADGSTDCIVAQDSAGTEVFAVDSDGAVTTSGSITLGYVTHNVLGIEADTATISNGLKIKTNIPFTSFGMNAVWMEGYDYRSGKTFNVALHWYVHNDTFFTQSLSSYGAYTPTIKLAAESGLVVIWIDNNISDMFFLNLAVRYSTNRAYSNPAYARGWTWADEAITGTPEATLTYSNSFGNIYAATGSFSGNLDVGYQVGTGEAALRLGASRTASGYAYIDLIGDTTYTDYGLRLIRGYTGANTASTLLHRGTGDLEVKTQEAAAITLFTSNAERMRITSTGNVLLGTTSEPGTASRLVVKGSTADGSTDCIVAQDSAGTSVFAVDSDGNTTAASVNTTGDISQDADTYHYLAGDASTDGSIRQYYDSTDDCIYMQKRESGSWVTKHTFTM